ncbi:MAG: flagellar protein FliL [Thermoanaerobacterium sp.]|uniref:Flagellar protein FliL n=1 Tax=Thermoanaerobacterium butyriciformans TaxID=1702242 RepID=A0ABS4NGU8_9THEO|nr:flagellar basal body-associated FliL family protein [Thermoanaerobacterium butyriciformans]MBP2072901.1 flagellar FliL protein [Thermoanaerobacterium butyriciformans]MDK2805415.1 flagellar protein FliL [Thermoanaerobacterium sp.]MDN5316642.1 flagellar protein FliL [Thermoanaerobacterium sp.]WHE08167.1 flagellar basal body-associated FliL family protein [Thermoanaerobacterium thermosaccharolyticum]
MKNNIIIIVLLVIIIAFGGAFFYFNYNSKPAKIVYYNYSPGDEFVTNLKDDDKFIKAGVELEVYDKNVLNELKDQNPKIRDAILQILRNKTAQDLEGSAGQAKLQNEIKNEINKILGADKITNVYFDDFIVQ